MARINPFGPRNPAQSFMRNTGLSNMFDYFSDPAAAQGTAQMTPAVSASAPVRSAASVQDQATASAGGLGAGDVLGAIGDFGQIIIDPQTGALTVQRPRKTSADRRAEQRRLEIAEEDRAFRKKMQLARLNISQQTLQQKMAKRANAKAGIDRLIERWGQ